MEILEHNKDKDSLIVHELVIKNKEVVDFIVGFEAEKRQTILVEIIELGVKSFKSFLTENYGQTIDNHFDLGIGQLNENIAVKIRDIEKEVFEPFIEGAKTKILDKFNTSFDEKRDKLLKEIDEKKDKIGMDVLDKFMKDFSESSEKLMLEINKFVVKENVVSGTTLKGERFESYLYDLSCDISSSFGDYVEHVGKDDDTGDIMVESGDKSISFCVEAKDKTIKSEPELKKIFDAIEKKRLVGHSIIVFKSSKQIPEKVGQFRTYGTNRMILTLSDGEEEIKPFLFKVGYRVMRLLAAHDGESKKVKNIEEVITKINDIKTKVSKISTIRKTVTEFTGNLHDQLDSVREDVLAALEDMEKGLIAA